MIENFLVFLFLTILLGVIFTGFQVYEYQDAATFAIDEGIYPSTFYTLQAFMVLT